MKIFIAPQELHKPTTNSFIFRTMNTKSLEDVFQNELQPVVKTLRLLGALPIHTNKKGIFSFHIFSWMMAYSTLLYMMIISGLVYLYFFVPKVLLIQNGFKTTAFYILWVSIQSLTLVTPLIVWPESSKFIKYSKKWKEYQVNFVRTTNVNVILRQRRCWIFIFTCIFVEAAICILYLWTTTGLSLRFEMLVDLLCFTYVFILRDTLSLFWRFNCCSLAESSDQLLSIFKSEADGKFLSSQRAADFRCLWLQLATLACQFGESFNRTYCFFTMYNFSLLCLFTYSITVSISEWRKAMICFLYSSLQATALFTFCKSGNDITEKVRDSFKEQLLLIISKNSVDNDFVKQVNIFLQVINSYDSQISLKGYIIVNNRLFVSFCAALVTYLVVLLQFDGSAN